MGTGAARSVAALAALSPAEAESVPFRELQAVLDAATDSQVAEHPVAWLHLARACEPGLRLRHRSDAIDRLVAHVGADDRLEREVRAEQALDLARNAQLDAAEELARRILGEARPDDRVAYGRASEALGRVLAWRGDELSARAADRHLSEAAQIYTDLGTAEWLGFLTFWRGNALFYQHGRLAEAREAMSRALEILALDSPRRGVVLTFYADVLTTVGDWPAVDAALTEARALADRHGDDMTSAYAEWQAAKVASARGDAVATMRHLSEAERHRAEWFDLTSGSTFLADAAELLDRVGRHDSADDYVARAVAIDADDEFVLQARALLLARRGDPDQALEALHELTQRPWLEPRLTWRRTMFVAWASLRAHRDGVGTLAARALEQAQELGAASIAVVGEPAITAALLPLAAAAGSAVAMELLSPGGRLVVRVLGQVSIRRDTADVTLPTGRPSMLVRLLAIHPGGLELDEVVDTLWPETDADTGRRRLRDTLARLKARSGDLVVRTGSRLLLAPAWVDATAFRAAADRALSSGGRDGDALAVAALALWTGDLLPSDPYEAWATGPREQLRRRRLDLLDLVAAQAADRGSYDEARQALEQAIEADPFDDTRYVLAARHLLSAGRREPARRMLARAVTAMDELGLAPPAELRQAILEADRV
jgi:DNA-binding SARP family transcriptional activator